MKETIAAISVAIADLKTKGHAAMSKLPPLDSLQVGEEVGCAINCLRWSMEDLARLESQVVELDARLLPAIEGEIASRIAAGDLVTKAVMEGAVAAARNDSRAAGIREVEDRIAAEKARADLITARRADLMTVHGVKAVEGLSDEVLASAEFDPVIKVEFARRVTALCEIGIKPEEKAEVFGNLACAIAFDDSGRTIFDGSIAAVIAATGVTPKPAGSVAATLKPGSGAPTLTTPAATPVPEPEARKPVVAF